MAMTIFKKKQKGFTLLEMLISVTLFSVVMIIALSAVLTILDLNRKTQSLTAVTNSMNTAIDSMVRLIKSGEKGFAPGGDTSCPNSEITFQFFDIEGIYDDTPQVWDVKFEYRCSDRALYRSMEPENGTERLIRLTPEGVKITNARFDVTNACQDKVGIFIEGTAGANKTKTDFTLQTTVTRRSVVGTGSCN
jgi:prepilin-type N-terminal cleavage/methylation domain-containing protein